MGTVLPQKAHTMEVCLFIPVKRLVNVKRESWIAVVIQFKLNFNIIRSLAFFNKIIRIP